MKNKSNQRMRAVAIDEFGGIEKMKPRKLPVAEVATDEILVRVDTAGVGVWDPFEREGGFAKEFGMHANFPYVLGADGGAGDCGIAGRWSSRLPKRSGGRSSGA